MCSQGSLCREMPSIHQFSSLSSDLHQAAALDSVQVSIRHLAETSSTPLAHSGESRGDFGFGRQVGSLTLSMLCSSFVAFLPYHRHSLAEFKARVQRNNC